MTGTVKFFKKIEGFGFIVPSNSSQDIIVHQSVLRNDISQNDQVTFDVELGDEGFHAVNVEVIHRASKF
jgi:cold shock protein